MKLLKNPSNFSILLVVLLFTLIGISAYNIVIYLKLPNAIESYFLGLFLFGLASAGVSLIVTSFLVKTEPVYISN